MTDRQPTYQTKQDRFSERSLEKLRTEIESARSRGYDGVRIQFESMRVTAYRESESRRLSDD